MSKKASKKKLTKKRQTSSERTINEYEKAVRLAKLLDSYVDKSLWSSLVSSNSISSLLESGNIGHSWLELTRPIEDYTKLNQEIIDLQRNIYEQFSIDASGDHAEATERTRKKLEDKVSELESKLETQYLLDRVTSKAHSKILENGDFRSQFSSNTMQPAFVVALDIRRSTDLMLKARSATDFAAFIVSLCKALERIVKENYGIVDKFTGDGVLAFFPPFFSGDDAGYRAIKAIDDAHTFFARHYKKYRSSFNVILDEVGLGAGIDYGHVHLVQVAGALTVVGHPVVYACRLSGAPANTTLVNQPAYDELREKYHGPLNFFESSLTIKSDGRIVCYEAVLEDDEYQAEDPNWL
jgi:class 3 adenylate cyclase